MSVKAGMSGMGNTVRKITNVQETGFGALSTSNVFARTSSSGAVMLASRCQNAEADKFGTLKF